MQEGFTAGRQMRWRQIVVMAILENRVLQLLRGERAPLERMECDVSQAIAMRNNGLRCRPLAIRTSWWIG